MSSAPDCTALQAERKSPDLRILSDVAGDVAWVADDAADNPRVPLVLSGEWAARNPNRAAQLFAARSSAGGHTIIVPRFRPGDWTKMLAAPTKVEVVASEFRSFEWQIAHHAVPGFVVFRTSLHAAKWGHAPGLGVVVLGYRPNLTAGVIVLCSAVLTARMPGVAVAAQQALYRSIVDAAAAPVSGEDATSEPRPVQSPATVAEFLAQEGELGAAFLLGRLIASEDAAEVIADAAKSSLGIAIASEDARRLAAQLPANTTGNAIRDALQRQGWGAFLRRLPVSTAPEGASRE